jgi:hypothetical protein
MRFVTQLTSPEVRDSWLSLLLYVGPDLLLPLTSALAAIAGVLLMFWNRVLNMVRAGWRLLFDRNKTPRG